MSIPNRRTRRICSAKIPVGKAFQPRDLTWVYGSTEDARQNYINNLIEEEIRNDPEGTLRDRITRVDKITKSGIIKGIFAEGNDTKILVVNNLKAANLNEEWICRLIDGGCFSLSHYYLDNIHIFADKIYISSNRTPEQVYARFEFKERVIRRVTRVIKLD